MDKHDKWLAISVSMLIGALVATYIKDNSNQKACEQKHCLTRQPVWTQSKCICFELAK